MSYGERQRIKARIDRILDGARGLPEEVQAELARYLCVLGGGLLEVSGREIFGAYASRRSDPSVLRYVGGQLDRFRNANVEKLLQLAGAFCPERAARFEAHLNESLRDGVSSIIHNRHNVAHGRNVEISLGRFRSYYERVCEVLALLEGEFTA